MNTIFSGILLLITAFAASIFTIGATIDYFLHRALTPPSTNQNALPQSGQPSYTQDDGEWGVAKKIGEHTYSIKVGQDDRMATPQEVVEALNNYRQTNGKGALTWDDKLAAYSQGRADYFKSEGKTDAHAGFDSYLEYDDGFTKLGFNRLGENSYFGGPLYGVHLIEWVFARSPEHNANQLDPGWTHVGVGVTNTSANLIFGGKKM